MKIVTDGTPMGTVVYDDDGEKLTNVVAIEVTKGGRKVHVTRRLRREDVEFEASVELPAEFRIAVPSATGGRAEVV